MIRSAWSGRLTKQSQMLKMTKGWTLADKLADDAENCNAVWSLESQDQVCLSLLQILLILVRFRLILLEWIGNELYFVCNSFSLFEWFLCNFWLARVIFSQFFEVRECYCCLYYFIDKIWLIRVHIVFVHGNCVHANTEWKYIEKGIYFVGM